MKKLLIKILSSVLKKLSQLTIWKYRPSIIGVTGSVGKTSAKLAISAVLGGERVVRYAKANFNNELGVPLTVLGDWEEIKGIFFWPKVICSSIFRLVIKVSYPEILILEYGVDRPGDMKYLLQIARPNIGVITAIGETPAHVEFFGSPDELVREKARLIEYLPTASFAILNKDDDTVTDLENKTRAHVMTFGFQKDASVRITNFENREEDERPVGITFKLEYGGGFVPVRMDGVFGRAHAYAASAAACVGLIFGLNLVKISETLKRYAPAHHRMELLPGIKYSYVIDDAYNASPLSMHAALDTLKTLPAKRHIAVLGDMLEIGKYTLEAHERVGRLAAKNLDILVTVGLRAKFIAEAARGAGMNKKNIYVFETAEEAAPEMEKLVKRGDLILVKASHSMHLEKVVAEIKAF